MTTELELAAKELTVRELRFVAAILSGENYTQSAIIAGYSVSRAKVQGSQMMHRPHIRKALGLAIDDIGVTFEEAIQPVRDALKATKTITDSKNGEIITTDEPDHSVRLKASALVLRLMGKMDENNNTKPPAAMAADNIELKRALENSDMDEVELQRLIFRKSS